MDGYLWWGWVLDLCVLYVVVAVDFGGLGLVGGVVGLPLAVVEFVGPVLLGFHERVGPCELVWGAVFVS